MKAHLISLLPRTRWIPHDLPTQEAPPPKPKSKSKTRNPFSSKTHGVLVTGRRKSTISLNHIPNEDDARTHAQSQSMFFARIPIEIRKMVYEYVVGEEVVHLTFGAKKRFGHFICEDSFGDAFDESVRTIDEIARECGCRVLVGGRGGGRTLNSGCIGMARSCRRMYNEAIPHLYRPHVFSLLHITHLLYLPTRLPQQRLNSIRNLNLRWAIRALPYLRRGTAQRLAYREDTANWEKGWSIIAGMTGLRFLYIVLVDPSPQVIWEANWSEFEDELLAPVKQVIHPRWFELVLPFASCRTDWNMGESIVVLRRPHIGEESEDGS